MPSPASGLAPAAASSTPQSSTSGLAPAAASSTPQRFEGEGGWALSGPPLPPRLLAPGSAAALPQPYQPPQSPPPTATRPASIGARPSAAVPAALVEAAKSAASGTPGAARPSSAGSASSAATPSAPSSTPQGLLEAGGFESIFGLMMLSNAALGLKMPITPTLPILPGLAGMSARNTLRPMGPMQQVAIESRATAAGEAIVNPLSLIAQGPGHPNYPPGIPTWYAMRKMMPGPGGI